MLTRSAILLSVTTFLFALATLIVPSGAVAEARVVDRQVSQTTGAEMALGMLADVRAVDVDRTGMTVTLEQAGEVHPVRVELGSLLGLDRVGADDTEGGGLLRLGTLLVAMGVLFRVVRGLARLAHEEG